MNSNLWDLIYAGYNGVEGDLFIEYFAVYICRGGFQTRTRFKFPGVALCRIYDVFPKRHSIHVNME